MQGKGKAREGEGGRDCAMQGRHTSSIKHQNVLPNKKNDPSFCGRPKPRAAAERICLESLRRAPKVQRLLSFVF